MPITPSISVSQSALAPNLITVEDTSTGSDGAIASRRIFFQTPFGTYLVESGTTTDYEVWSYADASETFDVLNQDWALAITVQWLDSGNAVLYTLTQVYCFNQYNRQFYYYLWQQMALTYKIIADGVYFNALAAYWQNIIGAEKAVEIGADIAASQACLDRATNMKENQSIFFN